MTAKDPRPSSDRSRGGESSLLAGRVANMHFSGGLSNRAIADSLGISRFRVARLIDHARETGIVTITITPPVGVDGPLSDAVRAELGLADVLVLPLQQEEQSLVDAEAVRAAVGALAARYLDDVTTEGMTVGISWGRTVDAIAAGLEARARPTQCDVVQLVGNLSTLDGSMHAGDLLRRFASAMNGQAHPLHAPLVLPDESTAVGIRSEESVARVLDSYDRLDVAVVGIGSWKPPSSRLLEVLSQEDVDVISALSPQADVCALTYSADGRPVEGAHSPRMIGISHAQLCAVPIRIGVASGPAKAAAVRASAAAGVLTALVIDAELARTLLS